jgi:hypothetical protein
MNSYYMVTCDVTEHARLLGETVRPSRIVERVIVTPDVKLVLTNTGGLFETPPVLTYVDKLDTVLEFEEGVDLETRQRWATKLRGLTLVGSNNFIPRAEMFKRGKPRFPHVHLGWFDDGDEALDEATSLLRPES